MNAHPRPGPAEPPADSLADELAVLVWRLSRLARAASLDDGVPTAHVALLAHLNADGALTGADLARRLGVTPQATAAAIATLRAQRLVERAAADGDERRRPVAITEAGAECLARVRRGRAASLEQGVLAGLDERERTVLAEAVRILGAGLDPRRPGRL